METFRRLSLLPALRNVKPSLELLVVLCLRCLELLAEALLPQHVHQRIAQETVAGSAIDDLHRFGELSSYSGGRHCIPHVGLNLQGVTKSNVMYAHRAPLNLCMWLKGSSPSDHKFEVWAPVTGPNSSLVDTNYLTVPAHTKGPWHGLWS